LEEICTDLKDELNVSRLAMIEKAASLFHVLDTDKVKNNFFTIPILINFVVRRMV